jgi:hypothetical protein
MNNTHVFTSLVATKQCNGDKKYLLSGNIAPHQWYKRFCDEDGNPDLVSITNLADVLAWYRNGTSNQFGNNSPKFIGNSLCVSYDYFEDKFGFKKDRVRRSFVRLEEQGVLKRTVKNIELAQGVRVNRIFITLNPKFYSSCFSDSALDIRVGRDLPANDLHVNSSTFSSCSSNSTPSLHQCNYHISNKKNIKKDRSMNYASIEASSGSNFLENSLVLKEKIDNNFLEISAGSVDKNNNALALQILSNLNPDNQAVAGAKEKLVVRATITNTNSKSFPKPKTLVDFYPLNKEDCIQLQILSGRDFSLNATNEILHNMSKRLVDRVFYSRKGFLSYMSTALRYEMRDAVKTSNENFKIRANLDSEERRAEEIENYLTEIEYSTGVSPEWHLKKKLACVLESAKAYSFLKAYRSIAIEGDTAKIYLHKAVQLSQGELDLVLSQVKATHERFENGEYNPIQKIELIMPKVMSKTENLNRIKQSQQLPNTLWGKVRSSLIGVYGEAIDVSWFSKIEATEDIEEKEINLKAPSEFIKDWIERNYEQAIEQAAGAIGVRLRGLEC